MFKRCECGYTTRTWDSIWSHMRLNHQPVKVGEENWWDDGSVPLITGGGRQVTLLVLQCALCPHRISGDWKEHMLQKHVKEVCER